MRGAGSRVKRPRPKRGGEEGEGAKGPQAESTLTYALPSLVGKWFTGIGCHGSPGSRAHFDLSVSFVGIPSFLQLCVVGYVEQSNAKPFPNGSTLFER